MVYSAHMIERHSATRPRSARFHSFESGAGHFVFDVESGSIQPISRLHANVLEEALRLGDHERADLTAKAFGLATHAEESINLPTSVPVRAISLAVAQKCNLACTYCYAQQGTFGQPARSMPPDVARTAIDRLIKEAVRGEPVTLAFMGGEPLVNRRVLHAATRYAAEEASARGIPIGFSMTTNGTLISGEDIALFQEFAFALTISVDGLQEANDQLRPYRSGKGSFDKVTKNVAALLALEDRRYRVSARVTVTPKNLNLPETLQGLIGLGFDEVMFSPMLSAPSGNHQLAASDLDSLLDELVCCGELFRASLREGRVLPFMNVVKTLRRIHSQERDHYPCGAGGGYMGVSADGGMYACHRFVDDEDGRLGDAENGVDPEKQVRWLTARHVQSQSPCTSCWARHLCSGSCHYESMKRGRPACDYIRGWIHYCLGLYTELREREPLVLKQILEIR